MNTAPLFCPTCRGPVRKLRREMDATDHIALFFSDVPFWVLFGVCVAIGMWQWLAGVVSFGVMALAFYLWERGRSRFRCNSCNATYSYPDVLPTNHGDA